MKWSCSRTLKNIFSLFPFYSSTYTVYWFGEINICFIHCNLAEFYILHHLTYIWWPVQTISVSPVSVLSLFNGMRFTFRYLWATHKKTTSRGEAILCLPVSEDSVHGDLVTGTWAEHHVRGSMVGRFFTLCYTEDREQGKGWTRGQV